MNYTIRSMTDPERLYAYTQSSQIGLMTGSIGHLRADFDSGGESFFSSWDDFDSSLKTDEFRQEFDELINHLRFGDDPDCFLKNRTGLSMYCFAHPEASDQDIRNFFFRVDTEEYVYLFRLNPNKGDYNMYCYPYRKDQLDRHLHEAERGIRFIDTAYRDLFRVKDGAKIRVRKSDGENQERVCRYIDPTHFEYGSGPYSVFHIAQFADWMAAAPAVPEPVDEADVIKEPQRNHAGKAR